MIYDIPGYEKLKIDTLILDLNGTLTVGGNIPEGARERLDKVKGLGLKAVLLTGNTRGDADDLASELGIDWQQAKTAEDKRDIARTLDPETCASIGNGRIDLELMKIVKLAIVTLQAEGVHTETLANSDIIVPTINDALDLFIDSDRLIATMRR
jgi:soluble P-type ATPase